MTSSKLSDNATLRASAVIEGDVVYPTELGFWGTLYFENTC